MNSIHAKDMTELLEMAMHADIRMYSSIFWSIVINGICVFWILSHSFFFSLLFKSNHNRSTDSHQKKDQNPIILQIPRPAIAIRLAKDIRLMNKDGE